MVQQFDKNKLVAKFMGYTYFPYGASKSENFIDGWKTSLDVSEFSKYDNSSLVEHYLCRDYTGLRYNESYDWLMPVVDRINSMHGVDLSIVKTHVSYSVQIGGRTLREEILNSPLLGNYSNTIRNLFELVVRFVGWYNSEEQD